ncbi:sugar ABC transporter ATP-binding protein [Neorhizobium sp. P12A]|jgi:ABC-type sugar transport system ATPase subunit|uniref:ATP-binding cassette domain-containing protein n=1 Tax=Neorhizobium sp. P12A TaxID=2268027 RepID=UPI0011EF2434|nr:ATP-binding cassette domain-containing protein [Neorhizobium sp. P12A]KAA0683854.1 sugar ABC transporter ATP-binding protein [Neorhizobium sp. P12A]
MVFRMSGIVKRFGGLVALNHVDFEVADSEVMALVGDNGAGKSTLIKTMSGAHVPDEGEIRMLGEIVRFRSPQDAWKSGVATIYQELALAGKMTVVDNIFLGREIKRPRLGIPFLDLQAMRNRTTELLAQLDVHVPSIDSWVEQMSGGQRQGVAIARALNMDARLIIMDEPTAALAVAEVRKVLDFVVRLRQQGKSVVLISHNIQDVFEVSDRISVMRHGRCIAVRETRKTTPQEIIGLITGAHEVRAVAS